MAHFGEQLKEVFLRVRAVTTKGQSQRERFFGKAKDKIDDEIKLIQEAQKKMQQTKVDIDEDEQRKAKLLAKQQKEEKERYDRELANQKLIDDQNKIRTQIMEEIERQKVIRAMNILQLLASKGFKKIGKYKIVEMLNNQNLIKYDTVMDFYQNWMKKEKEKIEENKKKKLKEVELQTRSQREEEKILINKNADDKADAAMDRIAEAIRERQEKEIREREMLSTAQSYYQKKMSKLMEIRNKKWEEKK